MRKLVAECRVSAHELLMINTSNIEKMVKERLARELANSILNAMEVTESMDCMDMTKVIKAELVLADQKDIKLLYEADKFINNMKEEF